MNPRLRFYMLLLAFPRCPELMRCASHTSVAGRLVIHSMIQGASVMAFRLAQIWKKVGDIA